MRNSALAEQSLDPVSPVRGWNRTELYLYSCRGGDTVLFHRRNQTPVTHCSRILIWDESKLITARVNQTHCRISKQAHVHFVYQYVSLELSCDTFYLINIYTKAKFQKLYVWHKHDSIFQANTSKKGTFTNVQSLSDVAVVHWKTPCHKNRIVEDYKPFTKRSNNCHWNVVSFIQSFADFKLCL